MSPGKAVDPIKLNQASENMHPNNPHINTGQQQAFSVAQKSNIFAINEISQQLEKPTQTPKKDQFMIVGVTGAKHSGKRTFADYLVNYHGFTKVDLFDIQPELKIGQIT